MNKKIYVIATENQYGYEPDSCKPMLVTEVLPHLGAWEDNNLAELKALELNAKEIPEDDSPFENETYFVLELKVNT